MATQVFKDEQSVARFHTHWNRRIDALADGALGDEAFIAEVMGLDRDARESPWAVIAIMDRRVRRGQLSGELFHGIESRIAQREFAQPETEQTVDLPPPPQRFVTQRIRTVTPEELAAEVPASDAPAAPPPDVPVVNDLAAGTVLAERYVIRGCVGEGGMGRVYQALDRARRDQGEVDWHVAVKVLHESTQNHPEALARLRREFDIASRLGHRNIIRVYELAHDGPLDFFTMEFLLGELLSKFLSRFHGEPLPRDEAWSIIRDIGTALAYAHELGVVHADLQPQNIMMLKSGHIKLMDFGAAAAGDIGQVTPGYASLELLAGLPPDPRDDLYALACIGYELLAGTHPFDHRRASEARSLGLVPVEPRGLNPAQWDLLQQALGFERAARPANVRGWLEGLGLETPPAVSAPRVPFVFERPESLLALKLADPPAADVPVEAAPIEVDPAEEIPLEVIELPAADAPDASLAERIVGAEAPVMDTPVVDTVEAPAIEEFEIPLSSVAAAAEPPQMQAAPVIEPTVVLEPEVWRPGPPTVAPPAARPIGTPFGKRSSPVRWISLGGAVALVALCAYLWHRQAPDNNLALAPLAAPEPLRVAPPDEADTAAAARPAAKATPAKSAAVAKKAPSAVAVHAPAPAVKAAAVRKPARPAAPPSGGTVSIASAAYRVPTGGRFAEIKVTRTDASKPLSFLWWTEEGNALAGVDYIAQPRSTAYFAAGARSVTLFVKIAANSPRKQSARFSVLIARPSIGVLGASRTAVTLAPGR